MTDIKRHAREGDDELVMLDGRRFFTHDNWQTVFLDNDGKVRRVAGEQADRIPLPRRGAGLNRSKSHED